MSFTPVIKRNITLPQLKLEENKPIYVRILCEIYKGKEVEGSDMEAPMLTKVINLATGEMQEIVVGSVLHGVLTEDVKQYEGLCFMITMGAPPEGKRYRTYEISEIEDPDKNG